VTKAGAEAEAESIDSAAYLRAKRKGLKARETALQVALRRAVPRRAPAAATAAAAAAAHPEIVVKVKAKLAVARGKLRKLSKKRAARSSRARTWEKSSRARVRRGGG